MLHKEDWVIYLIIQLLNLLILQASQIFRLTLNCILDLFNYFARASHYCAEVINKKLKALNMHALTFLFYYHCH